MCAKYNKLSADELKALSNKDVLMNWTRLASFIMAVEKISWNESCEKALAIFSDKEKANELVNEYRERITTDNPKKVNKSVNRKSKDKDKEEPITQQEPVKSSSKEYHENFKRLEKVAPDLVEHLSNADLYKGKSLYGKSIQTGYMDFTIELTHQDKDYYHLSLSHYFEQNGDLVPDPDMVVRVDLKNETLEALTFQNPFYYRQVYDDIYKRDLVREKERKSQNEFLSQWLKNLIQQGHEVVWRNDEEENLADSELHIEFNIEKKAESPNAKTEKENMKTPKPQSPTKSKADEQTNDKTHYFKYLNTLTAIVKDVEGITDTIKAEKKAKELIESNKAFAYVCKNSRNNQHQKVKDLLSQNFELLFIALPKIKELKEDKEINIEPSDKKLPIYILEHHHSKENITQYSIVEDEGKNRKILGRMIIAIDERTNLCWVQEIANDFLSQEFYQFKKPKGESHSFSESLTEQRYQANLILRNWLILLLKYYSTLAQKIVTDNDSEDLTSREEWLKNYKDNASEIPHFEAGKVQLTPQHIKAGITQKDIDWINQNQSAMLIRPAKQIVYNTVDKKMDKRLFAQKPGLRISKFGKIYYEGRSNRSDKGNKGL